MFSLLEPYRKLKDHAARVIHIEAQLGELTAELRAELASLRERVGAVEQIAAQARDHAALAVRTRPPKPPYRVLFLVHNPEAWYALADVYAEMAAAPDFSTLVASIPRRYPGSPEFKDEDHVHARLVEFGVPHLRFNHPDPFQDLVTARAFAPDVIFRQSQWEPDVPEAFSAAQLSFARLCLVPYTAMSLLGSSHDPGRRNPAHDTVYAHSVWRVFHANDLSRAAALAAAPWAIPDRHLVTGHPKGETLLREASASPGGDGRFTVLWSSHHSITDEWSRFGTFHQTAFDMVEVARTHPQWTFVFSPHPALRTRLEAADPPLSREFVDRFWDEWNALPNTELFPGGAYAGLFARSNVLVSDGISWLLEFQLLKRPVVFLERENHRALSEIGEIALAGMNRVSSISEAVTLLETLADGGDDPMASGQHDVVARLFGEPGAAHRVGQVIREGLAAERDG